jgi:prepilin-type N-terminal cleavage/methylation domain-containing protein
MKTRIERHQSSAFGPTSAVPPSRNPKSQGFTLIELMMVILVILVLAGMLFKLGPIIRNRSERAKALQDLANIEHALNEYYAEYNMYPPVQTTVFKYERFDLQPPVMKDPGFTNYVDVWHYGLYSHLYARQGPAKPNPKNPGWNPDTVRDVKAKERWKHYLTKVRTKSPTPYVSNDIGTVVLIYSNGYSTMVDPWGAEYKYESKPPYLSYRLWSSNLD